MVYIEDDLHKGCLEGKSCSYIVFPLSYEQITLHAKFGVTRCTYVQLKLSSFVRAHVP